jgi:hypothetical protein
MEAAAVKAASQGRAAAERAATSAFEGHLDHVVAIGWAYVEYYCLDNFCNVRRLCFGWDIHPPT